MATSPTTPTLKLYNGRQCIDVCMLTLLLGREAGNQKDDAILAVGCTVRNRVLRPGFWNWGRDWEGVIEAKWQYSSINGPPNDPNLAKYPNLNVEPWERCLAIAEMVYAGEVNDPTHGATHYFDRSLDLTPPLWARNGQMAYTVDIGAFHFYRPLS
jgi:N-acetylmuramoyl-L-alanine amidase